MSNPFLQPSNSQMPITAFHIPMMVHGAPNRKHPKMMMSVVDQPPAENAMPNIHDRNASETRFSTSTVTRLRVRSRTSCNPAGVK